MANSPCQRKTRMVEPRDVGKAVLPTLPVPTILHNGITRLTLGTRSWQTYIHPKVYIEGSACQRANARERTSWRRPAWPASCIRLQPACRSPASSRTLAEPFCPARPTCHCGSHDNRGRPTGAKLERGHARAAHARFVPAPAILASSCTFCMHVLHYCQAALARGARASVAWRLRHNR